jgi:hypothetical protein
MVEFVGVNIDTMLLQYNQLQSHFPQKLCIGKNVIKRHLCLRVH